MAGGWVVMGLVAVVAVAVVVIVPHAGGAAAVYGAMKSIKGRRDEEHRGKL